MDFLEWRLEQVEQALGQANIHNVNVAYDKNENLIYLSGSVDCTAERQHAQRVATTAVSSGAKVRNALTVEDVGYFDGQLRLRLSATVDRDTDLTNRNIELHVNNGVVTVKGAVRSAAEKNRIGELVKAAPGVKDFADELAIAPER